MKNVCYVSMTQVNTRNEFKVTGKGIVKENDLYFFYTSKQGKTSYWIIPNIYNYLNETFEDGFTGYYTEQHTAFVKAERTLDAQKEVTFYNTYKIYIRELD